MGLSENCKKNVKLRCVFHCIQQSRLTCLSSLGELFEREGNGDSGSLRFPLLPASRPFPPPLLPAVGTQSGTHSEMQLIPIVVSSTNPECE